MHHTMAKDQPGMYPEWIRDAEEAVETAAGAMVVVVAVVEAAADEVIEVERCTMEWT